MTVLPASAVPVNVGVVSLVNDLLEIVGVSIIVSIVIFISSVAAGFRKHQ